MTMDKIFEMASENLMNDLEYRQIECLEDMSSMMLTVINALVALADKYEVERDDLVRHFVKMFYAMAEQSTFKKWEVYE